MKRTIWAILSALILIMMQVGHVVIWGDLDRLYSRDISPILSLRCCKNLD